MKLLSKLYVIKESEIHMPDIDEAIDRVMMGPAKVSRVYDEKTKS